MGRSEGVSPEKAAEEGFSKELKLDLLGVGRVGVQTGERWQGTGRAEVRREQAWLIRGTQKEVQLAGG